MNKKRIVISAGGTGGHVIPALAVAKALQSKGAEVFYIGNKDGIEYEIIQRYNERHINQQIPFYSINVQKLYRSLTIKHILFPFKLLFSYIKSKKYLQEIKPDALIGFGGYVSGPPAMAARKLGIPIYLQEQNCKPGITNTSIGKHAKSVFLAFEESKEYFKYKNVYVTGNPVNITLDKFEVDTSERNKKYNLKPTNKNLFIVGGSQGSQFINELILENLDWFMDNNIDLIWQTGKNNYEKMTKKIKQRSPAYDIEGSLSHRRILLFGFSDSINELYSITDFVISRGGALTLSELEVHKLPAFIIPLPRSGKNEQYYNALNFDKRGQGVMFEQKDRAKFIEKFTDFISKVPNMYKDSDGQYGDKSIHLHAANYIATLLLSELEEGKDD